MALLRAFLDMAFVAQGWSLIIPYWLFAHNDHSCIFHDLNGLYTSSHLFSSGTNRASVEPKKVLGRKVYPRRTNKSRRSHAEPWQKVELRLGEFILKLRCGRINLSELRHPEDHRSTFCEANN